MNDEQFFLANAYLDGELTDDERAIAEADPAVMAEVEELRALQGSIRDVEPPSVASRESAIAAAMAEFGAAAMAEFGAAAAPAAAPTATTIPFRRRRAYSRYLAVAAGVLGVGLLGVAVTRLGSGGDDDSSADMAAEPAAEEPAAEEPAEAATTEREMAETMSADEPALEEPAAEMAVAEDAAADAGADEPAEEPAAEEPAAEEPAAEEPAYDIDVRPSLVPGQVLTSPAELGAYGTGLIEQRDAGTLPPTPNHDCPIDNVLGAAEYLTGDIVVPILVAIDEEFDLVLAFDDDTCNWIVDGPLYLD